MVVMFKGYSNTQILSRHLIIIDLNFPKPWYHSLESLLSIFVLSGIILTGLNTVESSQGCLWLMANRLKAKLYQFKGYQQGSNCIFRYAMNQARVIALEALKIILPAEWHLLLCAYCCDLPSFYLQAWIRENDDGRSKPKSKLNAQLGITLIAKGDLFSTPQNIPVTERLMKFKTEGFIKTVL